MMMEMFCGGGKNDNLRGDCQGEQFPEVQNENMPPKISNGVTPQLEKRLADLPVESHMKSRLRDALNSNSASSRLKAIRAISSGVMDNFTSFDVLHSTQEVTEEERQRAREMKPLSFQEVMANVIVYVEVRSGREDRTEGIKTVIAELGVKVNDRLLKNTTHVIFSQGVLSTYNKAKKWNIPIVSILWFEACRKCSMLMDPERYRPDDLDRYEHPELYKIKRHKFLRLESESPRRQASKSLLAKISSPVVTTPKILSKTTVNLLCDTPETNILVAQARGGKTDKETEKTLQVDDEETPVLRRSTRRASCTSVTSDTLKPFKSLRKSMSKSMELTPIGKLPDNMTLSKLGNISEGSEELDDMEITEIPQQNRLTTHDMQSMIESPQIRKEEMPEQTSRWTSDHGNSDMVIEDDLLTPGRLIFCSSATPGSSRRATIFQRRIEIIKEMTRAENKAKAKEIEDLQVMTPCPEVERAAVKPRRRTLCPIMTAEEFPEEPQPKRRKLFNPSAISEAAKTPKTPKKTTEAPPRNPPKVPPAAKKSDKRRSTLEFETETRNSCPPKKMEASLVITNIYGRDKVFMEESLKKLGGFKMAMTVTRATSHLVTSNPVRTLNMMRALIRGAWILSLNWVRESVKANRWLPEEPFELQHFAPAVRMNRCERQLLGAGFKMDLLRDIGAIFVSSRCNIPVKDMQELIVLCGGRVASRSLAKYILGDKMSQTSPQATLLNSKWLLDSVMARRVLPEKNYLVV